jgi:cystathionine beta-lyase
MNTSFILNHLGEDRAKYMQAVSPPIFQSSNFTFNSVDDMRQSLTDELNVPFYTRGCNPTVAIARTKVAALEAAEDALIFASGSAAISAALISQVQAGDHVICVAKPYGWTNKLLSLFLARFGVSHSFVDGTKLEHFEAAIRPTTKVIYLESPNSITFELQDIRAVAKLAQQHGIVTIMDNSYATPLYQQPISMGIDIVVHSATKYLGGHSDAVAGILCSSKQIIRQIFESEYMTLGGIISPNDAWLLMRGLRSLPMRMRHISETATRVITWLDQQPEIGTIYYPFHPKFAQYELAKQQMTGAGGLFSFLLQAENIAEVERFCNHLQSFLLACSWGGHENLVFPMCVLYSSQNYSNVGLPWNLIRMYIGLEDPDLVIADLAQALQKMKST